MPEVTTADLKYWAGSNSASEGVIDVLVGEKTALPLIEASFKDDIPSLRSMLAESQWTDIALAFNPDIIEEDSPYGDEKHVRAVAKSGRPILAIMLCAAIQADSGAVVTKIVDFAAQHGVDMSYSIRRETINMAFHEGRASAFEALTFADPSVATFNIGHSSMPQSPLDHAIAFGN